MIFMHYIYILMYTYDKTYCIFDCIHTHIYTHVYMHTYAIYIHIYPYTYNSTRKACTKIEQCLGGVITPELFFFYAFL